MTMLSYFGAALRACAPASPLAPRGYGGSLTAVLAAALLSACGSTPLPPWSAVKAPLPPKQRPIGGVPARITPTVPGVVVTTPPPRVPTPAVEAPPGAITTPVRIREIGELPYNATVAARFPDPGTRYATPGLALDRRSFTTNAELGQWLRKLSQTPSANGTRAALLDIGRSQHGTPIEALVITRAQGTTPDILDATKRPTIVLIGQQHGDEPASSEALLVVAKELTQGPLEPLTERLNVIIVPRANPDGAEAGTRATANGTDMDRDHLVLSTPEAQALAVLVRDYRPIAVLDAHEFTVAGPYLEKFKALQYYDALLQYATPANMPAFMTKASQEWYHQPMVKALKAQNLSSEWLYTLSNEPNDVQLAMGDSRLDSARNVNGLKNAVSFVVESRGIGLGHTHIQRRVHTHVTAITSALHSSIERAEDLEQVRSFVVRDISAQACRDQIVVNAASTPEQRDITMLDPDTGADKTIQVDWNSSLKLRTLESRARPCGYWLAANASTAIERLALLGVQVLRVAEQGSLLVDTYQQTGSSAATTQEALATLNGQPSLQRVQVALVRSAIDAPAGSYYVPMNQPLAALVVAALEPDTQSSYFAHRLIGDLADTARVMSTPTLVFEESE
jgi:hypothetical protein